MPPLPEMPIALALAHACVTWFLVGLIWTIQAVHYPLFALVGAEGYPTYQRAHMNRITWIVAPAMIAEALLAALLVITPLAPQARPLAWLAIIPLAVIWGSTAAIQAPMHARLVNRADPRLQEALVATNWVRTAAWTARGVLAALILVAAIGSGGGGP